MAEKIIEVRHLSKTFGTNTVLRDMDFTVSEGDVTCIIGSSGSGKSTLLRCINLLERPTLGQILIDGQDVTSLDGKALLQLRRKIGMIFQRFNLLMQRTVEENVSYPLEVCGYPKEKRAERVAELLELVDLSSKAKSYPVQLSGGQQQRVSIARALANNPPILLCDEPTSALDTLTTNSLLELLKDINQKLGVTVIIITHEMSVVQKICNKVAVINDAHIIEQGLTKDVLSDPKEEMTQLLLKEISAGGEVDG